MITNGEFLEEKMINFKKYIQNITKEKEITLNIYLKILNKNII